LERGPAPGRVEEDVIAVRNLELEGGDSPLAKLTILLAAGYIDQKPGAEQNTAHPA
jgi:hypothetical protein